MKTSKNPLQALKRKEDEQRPQYKLKVSCKNAIFIVPKRSKDVLNDDENM